VRKKDIIINSMTRDLRAYSRQTIVQLIIGGLLLLIVVGTGLIYLIYGREAAIFGLVCILAGLSPLVLIWIALAIIDWVVKRANP
jgi:hypothetical protein